MDTKVGNFFTSKEKYKAEIEDLESEIADLQSRLADYEQTKQKLELYEGALEIKESNPDYKFVSAVIIGKDSSNAFTTFTFNKGSADGISVNDPVIYGKGQLVGVVTKVSATYCVVSTILDPNVNVSAYEVRTRESGFVSNTASISKDGFCRLSGLDRNTSIAAGGIVCTLAFAALVMLVCRADDGDIKFSRQKFLHGKSLDLFVKSDKIKLLNLCKLPKNPLHSPSSGGILPHGKQEKKGA